MEQKSTDRRIRKTKNALKDGLIELMLEKSINDITVRELTEKVDLNRGTFYLHYKDIFDLLEKIEEELFEEFNKIMDSHSPDKLDGRPLPLLEDIFMFLKDNASMTTVLLGRNGDIAFVNKIKDIIRKNCFTSWSAFFNSENMNNFDYFYTYILSGCLGLFESWLNNGLKESPHEIALLTESFILHGFQALK
jgi:AcrR family transcriptional regulator